jgi:pimeloyl-ACP methyl ester carboxylesterase
MTNPLIAARDRFAAMHPETRQVVNGRDWGVVDTGGAGPVLVLIPGTLGRGDIFWQQITALAPEARVIALTYPATGGVAAWADDIDALCAARGLGAVAVLGSSLGGFVAQYLAGTHPARVAHLFAANTLNSVEGIATRQPYASDLHHGPIETLREGFGGGLRAWAQAHPDQADLIDLLLAEVGGRIPEPELRRRLLGLKEGPVLPPCPLPPERITTIESDDDPLIPPPMRAAVRARLSPGVAYRFLSGGHFPYVARPALYTALLRERLGLAPRSGWTAGAEPQA